jgi:hypothetical protein
MAKKKKNKTVDTKRKIKPQAKKLWAELYQGYDRQMGAR